MKIAGSDLVVFLSLDHGLQLLITRLRWILIDFLFVHCQYCLELIRPSYSHHAQTNFLELRHGELHLLVAKPDPIWCENLEYRRHVKWN